MALSFVSTDFSQTKNNIFISRICKIVTSTLFSCVQVISSQVDYAYLLKIIISHLLWPRFCGDVKGFLVSNDLACLWNATAFDSREGLVLRFFFLLGVLGVSLNASISEICVIIFASLTLSLLALNKAVIIIDLIMTCNASLHPLWS